MIQTIWPFGSKHIETGNCRISTFRAFSIIVSKCHIIHIRWLRSRVSLRTKMVYQIPMYQSMSAKLLHDIFFYWWAKGRRSEGRGISALVFLLAGHMPWTSQPPLQSYQGLSWCPDASGSESKLHHCIPRSPRLTLAFGVKARRPLIGHKCIRLWPGFHHRWC